MKLQIKNFAQIAYLDFDLGNVGDLTMIVGPQATGKSLALQWLKLACDRLVVREDLERFGFDWSDISQFFDLYFGEGMRNGYRAAVPHPTTVALDGKSLDLSKIDQKPRGRTTQKSASTYYIPAHRSLLLAEGWPKLFQQYSTDTPYVARKASESLNALLLRLSSKSDVFPQSNRLQASLRTQIDNAVFHGNTVKTDASLGKKRLVLSTKDGSNIPFMAWTAGQREFVPLMLALYELLPPSKVPRLDAYETVILEEPELGLHPQAIMAVMQMVFHLLARGYRVVISTHSTLLLECAWAMQRMKKSQATATQLCNAFGLPASSKDIAKAALASNVRAYHLDYTSAGTVSSQDISSLDLFDESPDVAGWGGLATFSAKLSDAVAAAVSASYE